MTKQLVDKITDLWDEYKQIKSQKALLNPGQEHNDMTATECSFDDALMTLLDEVDPLP